MSQRDPGVANVFWDPSETLRCLECREAILPHEGADGSATYSIYYTSNEDPAVYFREIPRAQLARFLFYKFCGRACCTIWVERKGGNRDFASAADAVLQRAKALPADRCVLGGLYLGMPLGDALAVINAANGRNFTPRTVDGRLAFSSSSSMFYPCNLVTLRADAGADAPVRELQLEVGLLGRVIERANGAETLADGVMHWLKRRFHFTPSLAAEDGPRSRWLTAVPEPRTRLLVLDVPAAGIYQSVRSGSILWLRM